MARGRDKSSAAPVGRASASPSPMRQAGTVTHADVFKGQDGRSKGCGVVEFATAKEARPAAGAEAGLGALQRSIPGCARAEEAAALAVEGARYGAALARLAACDRAARTLLSGWRARHARRSLAAAKHARAAGVATNQVMRRLDGGAGGDGGGAAALGEAWSHASLDIFSAYNQGIAQVAAAEGGDRGRAHRVADQRLGPPAHRQRLHQRAHLANVHRQVVARHRRRVRPAAPEDDAIAARTAPKIEKKRPTGMILGN